MNNIKESNIPMVAYFSAALMTSQANDKVTHATINNLIANVANSQEVLSYNDFKAIECLKGGIQLNLKHKGTSSYNRKKEGIDHAFKLAYSKLSVEGRKNLRVDAGWPEDHPLLNEILTDNKVIRFADLSEMKEELDLLVKQTIQFTKVKDFLNLSMIWKKNNQLIEKILTTNGEMDHSAYIHNKRKEIQLAKIGERAVKLAESLEILIIGKRSESYSIW
ncbi:hypothetical protein ACQYRI_00210 [Salmonella enterica]